MKRILTCILLLIAAPVMAVNFGFPVQFHASVAFRPFAVTIADNGAGTAASSTLTEPVFADYRYTCSDTHGCELTLGETNVVDGQMLCIYNVGSNTITHTAAAGVLQLSTATYVQAQYQEICFKYQSDRWVENGRGGTSIGSAAVDLTANYAWTGLHSFAARTAHGTGATTGVATSNYFGDITPLAIDAQKTTTSMTQEETLVFYKAVANPAANTAFSLQTLFISLESDPTNDKNIQALTTANYHSNHRGSGTVSGMGTGFFAAITSGAGNIGDRNALTAATYSVDGASGDITGIASGIYTYSGSNDSDSTIVSDRTLWIDTPYTAGAMTTHYGLYIADQAVGTTHRSIKVFGTSPVEFDPSFQADGLITSNGGIYAAPNEVTGTDALVASDCGKLTTVTAGIDGNTITLPEASTVLGCTFTISYIGADGGALVDITPLDSDADGIEGGCTLAASVVTFSGTADADIGLTKATGLTGDFIRLTAASANVWVVTGCQGIWANN